MRYDAYSDLAIDRSGNIWVTGYFYDSIVVETRALQIAGSANFFIAKYDQTGRLLALKHFGQTTSDRYSWSSGITCDANGGIYVTGHFTGSANFGTTNLTSSSDDFFVLKCDSMGNLIWARQIRGISGCWSSRVALSPSGDVLVAGSFPFTLDFGSMSLTSRGEMDVFVASYDKYGNLLWVRQGGGLGYDCSIGLAVDAYGAGYVIGQLRGRGLFGTTNVLANNGDWFIAKTAQTFDLTVTTVGGGSVPAFPMEGSYLSNTVVTLAPTPAQGWTFLQWLGDATGTNPVASVSMSRNKCVEAVFGTVFSNTVVGSGNVARSPVAEWYPYGTAVRLTAVPQAGNYFALWANAASGTNTPLSFTVTNANPTVTAVFAALPANQHALTVVADGFGQVSTSPTGNRFTVGASVTLTAAPDTGQQFLGWSGDAGATDNPLVVTMNGSRVITAQFTKRPQLMPLLCGGGANPDEFQLLLTGEFEERYSIEAATNLALPPTATVWMPVATVTNVFGAVQFNDAFVTNRTQRFYRATVAAP